MSAAICQTLTQELRQSLFALTFPQREQELHATRNEQIEEIGLDPASIAATVRALVGSNVSEKV